MIFPLQQTLAARRAQLPLGTDAFRLLDGTLWPGVFVDVLADRFLVSLRDVALPQTLRRELEATGVPVYLKQLSQDDKRPPQQMAGPELPLRFCISENGLRFMMDMSTGYSQGIFLDQRDNRARLRSLCKPGMTVLNTFAYTGAFSVYAAAAGAKTTTLDLAQPCLDWCRENMQLNGIDPAEHFFCKGDALSWMGRFARKEYRFDIIVLDPPTFSRDEKGHVWKAERHYDMLVALAAACLKPQGCLLCTTNCRRLSSESFRSMVAAGIPGARLRAVSMPFDFDGEPYLKILWAER